jgi:nucleotide-binding universal stress UspA family protein
MEVEVEEASDVWSREEANPDELARVPFVRRVLVATDFSEHADRALAVGVRFAKALRATVELVHIYPTSLFEVTPPFQPPVVTEPSPEVMASIERMLETRAAQVRSAGLECVTASWGARKPDEAIVERAEKTGADLMVMGTHGRSGLAHALIGSVAERVVRKARCPVLVVPPPERSRT